MEIKTMKGLDKEKEGWIEVKGESNVWRPEIIGDEITGVYIRKEQEEGQWGLKNRYYLETENGERMVWDTKR